MRQQVAVIGLGRFGLSVARTLVGTSLYMVGEQPCDISDISDQSGSIASITPVLPPFIPQ
jgi:3-hydroxyisobutyrate dehydrogenase-like beta-hydroxyacid dehydrogenase